MLGGSAMFLIMACFCACPWFLVKDSRFEGRATARKIAVAFEIFSNDLALPQTCDGITVLA